MRDALLLLLLRTASSAPTAELVQSDSTAVPPLQRRAPALVRPQPQWRRREADSEEGEEQEEPITFSECPFDTEWEVVQLHHTKMTAMAHLTEPGLVVPGTTVRMHTSQPVVLSSVYHASAPDSVENVGSTQIDFLVADAMPWAGGGDAHDGIVIHLDFPAHVR